MIDPKMIPDEVVRVAMAAIDDEPFSSGPTDDLRPMRVSNAAALNAWPNAKTLRDDGRRQTYIVPALILPLPQEASDDQ